MVKRSRGMAFSSSDNEYSPTPQPRFSNLVVDSVLQNLLSNTSLPSTSTTHHPSASSSRHILSRSSHIGHPTTCSQKPSTSLSGAFSQARLETNRGLKGKARMTSGQKKNVVCLFKVTSCFYLLNFIGPTRTTKGHGIWGVMHHHSSFQVKGSESTIMFYNTPTIYVLQPTGDDDGGDLEAVGSDLRHLFPTLKQSHLEPGDLNRLEMLGLGCTDYRRRYSLDCNWTYCEFENSLLRNVLPHRLFTYLDGLPKVSQITPPHSILMAN